MAEQQLVDYIKKAKEAGQSDDQGRALLYKSGWTEAEVSEAFAAVNQPQAQPQPQPQPQPGPAGTPVSQPKVEVKPQVQPQAVQSNMPQVKKSHTALKLLMVLIIVVVLGGVGYFVAGQYINLPWNPLRPAPTTVIDKMTTNMKTVKSSHTAIKGEVDALDANKASLGKLSLDINGDSDMTDANNPKANFTFSTSVTLPGAASSLADASIRATIIGNTFYIKINSIKIPTNYLSPSIDISQFAGKWLKIDQNSITALAQAQGQAIALPQTGNSALTKQIQDLISSENMLSVTKQLADQTVSGQSTYHCLITISKDKLKDLVTKIMALLQTQNSASSNSLAINIAGAFVNSFVDAVGDINMEMWIGKKDYLLYRSNVDKTIDLSKIYPGANRQLEIKLDTVNSNFNKPATIQAPEGAQKIEDAVLPLLKPQKINSDMNQIRSIAQPLPGAYQSYSSLCIKGLLNGYLKDSGPDLVNLNNDIVSQGATKPACFSGATSYCVSTQLSDGSYLCIDETGATGTTKCTSSATVCK